MTQKTKAMSPAQSRLLQLMAVLIPADPVEERWIGRNFRQTVPPSQRRRPTVAALNRRGLIVHRIKRMGGGVYVGYYQLTEEARAHCASLPPVALPPAR